MENKSITVNEIDLSEPKSFLILVNEESHYELCSVEELVKHIVSNYIDTLTIGYSEYKYSYFFNEALQSRYIHDDLERILKVLEYRFLKIKEVSSVLIVPSAEDVKLLNNIEKYTSKRLYIDVLKQHTWKSNISNDVDTIIIIPTSDKTVCEDYYSRVSKYIDVDKPTFLEVLYHLNETNAYLCIDTDTSKILYTQGSLVSCFTSI